MGSIDDCILIQQDLDRFFDYASENDLSLNVDKCKIMRFYRILRPCIFDYKINNNILDSVETIKDLGVMLDTSLTFTDHYDYITNKAIKLLGFIKRSMSDFGNVHGFKMIYCSLIRSVLEYASNIWSPYYDIHVKNIERVQNKFLRLIA